MIFWLTTHEARWLWDGSADFPLFVSRRRLARYRSLHPATVPAWALDSGGFTELSTYGRWTITPQEYVAEVARYAREIGLMAWAAPMDWMCEPEVIHGGTLPGGHVCPGTGLSVAEHQRRTVDSYLHLVSLWPGVSDAPCPFVPVLQGWSLGEYVACLDLYGAAGVDLRDFPVVGLGSVCRRQNTIRIGMIVQALAQDGISLHGFGVKAEGLASYAQHLVSADSLAWSTDARYHPRLAECRHRTCVNCIRYARMWRDDLLDGLDTRAA